MKFCEEQLIINGWTYADINGVGAASDVVSLKNFAHATIILDFGDTALGGDADIVVRAADDVSATHSVAMNNYTIRKSPGTTSDDVFAAPVLISDSKVDYVIGGEIEPDTDDGCVVVIDIDAAQVKAAGTDCEYVCLFVTFGDPGQATPVGCKIVLSGPRHAAATMPSAIID